MELASIGEAAMRSIVSRQPIGHTDISRIATRDLAG